MGETVSLFYLYYFYLVKIISDMVGSSGMERAIMLPSLSFMNDSGMSYVMVSSLKPETLYRPP